MYEVPVKIYNVSKTTKRVNVKHPRGIFKVDTDKRNKQSIIVPGMHLELLVIFETDQPILKDEFDEIVINSENDFKLVIPLKAYLPQPLIHHVHLPLQHRHLRHCLLLPLKSAPLRFLLQETVLLLRITDRATRSSTALSTATWSTASRTVQRCSRTMT